MTSREATAFAFGGGEIGFQNANMGGLPKGALFLARGDADRIADVIRGMARRGYDNQTLLVPGVPEAADEAAAYAAFVAFFERVQVQLGPDSNFQSVRVQAGAPW